MRAPVLFLAAAAALLAAGPSLAKAHKPHKVHRADPADWTVRSPILVTPSAIPDADGTIVKMVPGARSGDGRPDISYAGPGPAPYDDAYGPSCGCAAPDGYADPRLERGKS